MNPTIYYLIVILAYYALKQVRTWYMGYEAFQTEKLHNDLLRQEIKSLQLDKEVLEDYIKEMESSEDVTIKYQLN